MRDVRLRQPREAAVNITPPDLSTGQKKKKKAKVISVTGREGPQGCETSRLPHFLDSRLTDGGEVVSLTRRPPFTPRKVPGTHFCLEAESTTGP
jgi:hypothetical protein